MEDPDRPGTPLHRSQSQNSVVVLSEADHLMLKAGAMRAVQHAGSFRNRVAVTPAVLHRRLKRRAILKNGDTNVIQTHVSKKHRKYLQDLFTTMVDVQWRYSLFVFSMSFILSWFSFGCVWWLIAITHGDLESELPEGWIPCVVNIQGFWSCFLFSVETQSTIGFGGRATTEECPEAITVMCIQTIFGMMMQAARLNPWANHPPRRIKAILQLIKLSYPNSIHSPSTQLTYSYPKCDHKNHQPSLPLSPQQKGPNLRPKAIALVNTSDVVWESVPQSTCGNRIIAQNKEIRDHHVVWLSPEVGDELYSVNVSVSFSLQVWLFPEVRDELCSISFCWQMLEESDEENGAGQTAFMVGFVFAKMARPKQRTQTLLFSRYATVSLRDGQLCLMFRVGDMRAKSHFIGTSIRAHLVKQHNTREGEYIAPFLTKLEVIPGSCLFSLMYSVA
ncbi:Inward rectifier potassium channel, variant 2 [Homalodisca vitripennis]|nr:Inward rectifier potassium channel, variant 2 [Homalodisca vitripennis]